MATELTQAAEPGEQGGEAAVSTDAETKNPGAEADPNAAAGTAEGDEANGDTPDKALKRMQRRIDKRTADVYRERARADQLAERVAALESQGDPKEETTREDPKQIAKHIAKVDRFTEKSNQLVEEGTSKHTDYMGAIKDLASEVGHLVNRDGTPSPFMEVVIEVSDRPAELLYYLGKNPDIAAELTELSPFKLAKRLDRIEREMADASKPKPNTTPRPLDPEKSAATHSSLPRDEDSTKDWLRKEAARLKAKGVHSYG